MIAFLTICYCGLVWLVFMKLKLLPWNRVSQGIVAAIGFFGILELLILINIYQPYSTQATLVQVSTPIVARVQGRVLDVPIKPNTPLKKGDVLFKVDSRPYQYQVDLLKAKLKLAKTRLRQSRELASAEAGSVYEVEQYEAEVNQLTAQLAQAELDLSETTLYAPADGFVTQLFLKPGAVTLTSPFSSVMNFVYTHEKTIAAPFRQNAVRYVKTGDPVEIALDTHPGKIITGSVVDIVLASAEGALMGSGNLKQSTELPPKGPVWVRIQVEDNISGMLLPVGSGAATAIFTDRGRPLSIIRKVIIRFYTWLNFL